MQLCTPTLHIMQHPYRNSQPYPYLHRQSTMNDQSPSTTTPISRLCVRYQKVVAVGYVGMDQQVSCSVVRLDSGYASIPSCTPR